MTSIFSVLSQYAMPRGVVSMTLEPGQGSTAHAQNVVPPGQTVSRRAAHTDHLITTVQRGLKQSAGSLLLNSNHKIKLRGWDHSREYIVYILPKIRHWKNQPTPSFPQSAKTDTAIAFNLKMKLGMELAFVWVNQSSHYGSVYKGVSRELRSARAFIDNIHSLQWLMH